VLLVNTQNTFSGSTITNKHSDQSSNSQPLPLNNVHTDTTNNTNAHQRQHSVHCPGRTHHWPQHLTLTLQHHINQDRGNILNNLIPQARALELQKTQQLTFVNCCDLKVNVPLQNIRFKLLKAYSNFSHFRYRKTGELGIQRLWFSKFTAVGLTPKDHTRIRVSIADSNLSHKRQTISRNSNRRARASASVAQLSVHWDGYKMVVAESVGGGGTGEYDRANRNTAQTTPTSRPIFPHRE
jgi:hypothetical protein